MVLVGVLVSVWIVSGVAAYFVTELAALHCDRWAWDRPTREFALVCSILLGPVYLLMAAELLVFVLIGEGLTHDHARHYKDS